MLLWKLAFKSLFVHRLKTLVTGLIIVLGTTLAIVGNSVVDAISGGMKKSLTNSITGDIQIYSSETKEKISVLGSMDGNLPDIGHHPNFKQVRDALIEKVPNIKSIIPMGINQALLNPGNLLDVKLGELRKAYSEKNLQPTGALKEHIRAIVSDIERTQIANRDNLGGIYGGEKLFEEAPADIAKALSPAFWSDFDSNYEERIEFLANRMAPLIFDDNQLFLSYIGTAPQLFQASFPQFEIASGEMIPEGKRGFLFSDYVYENQIKHRIARRLDQVNKQIEKENRSIADTKELQDKIAANVSQAAEIYNQLIPSDATVLATKLREFLESKSSDISELLKEFLAMNDKNFAARYKFFYDEIAPHIILYRVKIGDDFAITAYTKLGYSSSINLKVYGTYRFKSFESSPIASNFNVMDLVSFRKLFGFMTADRRAESAEIDREMGVGDVGRDDVEALFGAQSQSQAVKVEPSSGALAKLGSTKFGSTDAVRRDADTRFTREEMEDGVFLNAAIILKDPDQLELTMNEINKISKENELNIQAATWRESAGMIGQLTIIVRAVLYLFVAVIFAVATFIIMNSMLMATLERSREIGTMRAIGAQRGFLLGLFMRETFVLSFVFGAIGTLIGVAIVLIVGTKGIPAFGDVSTFFFSGNRLYLEVNPLHILIVFVCMTIVAVASTQYPAWRAMKISPLEAMQVSE